MKRLFLLFFSLFVISLAFALPHDDFPSFSSSDSRIILSNTSFFVSDTIIFNLAYYSVDGDSWSPLSLVGSSHPSASDWLLDSASASIPSNTKYLVVYSCSLIQDTNEVSQSALSDWDCHGRTSQENGFWQLYVFPFSETTDSLTSIFVDLGSLVANNLSWNIITDYSAHTETSLLDEYGNETTINLEISEGLDGIKSHGEAVNAFGYPGEVTRDAFWYYGGKIVNFTFSGLEPNRNYSVELFASRSGDVPRLVRYSINDSWRDIDVSYNSDERALFESVSTDNFGNMVITTKVSPLGSSSYGYIGSIILRGKIITTTSDDNETPLETCDDGLLNQDEEEVDCGGVCSACPECNVAGDCDDGDSLTVESCTDGICSVTSCIAGYSFVEGSCLENMCSVDTDCDDGDNTTTDTCEGTPKVCSNIKVNAACVHYDSECTAGCSIKQDHDCAGNAKFISADWYLKEYSDYSTIIYIDPDSGSSFNNGLSPDTALSSWSDIDSFQTGTAYLQKRGTTDELSSALVLETDIALTGAYGDDSLPKPIIKVPMFWVAGKENVIRDLKIIATEVRVMAFGCSSWNACVDLKTTVPINNVFYDVVITEAEMGIIGYGTKFLHSELTLSHVDGIFIYKVGYVEIGFSNISKVNQAWFDTETDKEGCDDPHNECWSGGDAIQIHGGQWWIHHNVLDRSDTGNKFCLISGADDGEGTGIVEHNTFYAPLDAVGGGAAIYLTSKMTDVVIFNNTFIGPGPNAIAGSPSDTIEVYQNTFVNLAGLGGSQLKIYDNVFSLANPEIKWDATHFNNTCAGGICPDE